ncbi:MAG TPA: hypothetical protein PKA95_07020, partial [Thermomicrobiales bacterium]|nr:hypothetical protein [Thermomicrobiales bacterium]
MAEMDRTSDIGGAIATGATPPRRQRPVLRRFMQNKLAVAGMVVIVFMYAVAIMAPVISRYDYKELTPGARNLPPSAE